MPSTIQVPGNRAEGQRGSVLTPVPVRLVHSAGLSLDGRLVFIACVDSAWLDSPSDPFRHSGEDLEGLGQQLYAGLAEFFDPPAVNDRVEDRLDVAEPQDAGAGGVE